MAYKKRDTDEPLDWEVILPDGRRFLAVDLLSIEARNRVTYTWRDGQWTITSKRNMDPDHELTKKPVTKGVRVSKLYSREEMLVIARMSVSELKQTKGMTLSQAYSHRACVRRYLERNKITWEAQECDE